MDSLAEINKFVLVTGRSTATDKDNKAEAIGNVEIIEVEIEIIVITAITEIIVITIKLPPLRSI